MIKADSSCDLKPDSFFLCKCDNIIYVYFSGIVMHVNSNAIAFFMHVINYMLKGYATCMCTCMHNCIPNI